MSETKDNFIRSAALITTFPRYTCPCRPPSRPYKHHLYPASQYSALLTALQAKQNEHEIRYIQYVVTPRKQILLALAEGTPAFTPTHGSMAYINLAQSDAAVLASGYLFIKEGKIMGVSNESDDFPNLSVESMLWVVAGLDVLNVPMEENLSIIPNAQNNTMQFLLTPHDRQQILEQLPLYTLQGLIAAHQNSRVIIREEASTIALTHHRDAVFSKPSLTENSEHFHHSIAVECH